MKKKTISILMGIAIAFATFAQESISDQYPDTLRMMTDNNAEITFAFDRISKDKVYLKNTLWKSILNVMETALQRSEFEEGVRISYENVKGNDVAEKALIKVSELPKEDLFIIGKEEIQEKLSTRIEFWLIQEDLAVSFMINNLNDLVELKEIKMESVWNQIKNEFENEGKVNLYEGSGTLKYGEAYIDKIEAKSRAIDNLEITFIGVGLGYYRDRFVPDVGSKLAFIMH
ncbi:MAG: hypothetical protein AAFY41_00375, partial [Bacteroidota bacterium]